MGMTLKKATLNAQQVKKLEKQGVKLTSLSDIIKLQGGPELGFLSLTTPKLTGKPLAPDRLRERLFITAYRMNKFTKIK